MLRRKTSSSSMRANIGKTQREWTQNILSKLHHTELLTSTNKPTGNSANTRSAGGANEERALAATFTPFREVVP